MNEPCLSSRSPETTANSTRQRVFCLEEIRPGASVCPHCGSALVHSRHKRDARAFGALTVQIDAAASTGIGGSRIHIQPAQIKGTAEAVKALWVVFGHMLF